MLVITGANGNLGRETIGFLWRRMEAGKIIAAVRNPAAIKDFPAKGILVKKADYGDPDSLRQAFEGAETVLQISTGGVDNPEAEEQESNVVAAMSDCGVKRIVYTSAVRATANAVFHVIAAQARTESLIRRTGIAYTFFRNSKYMESIPFLIGDALRTGEIRYPAASAKISFVARRDIAEALANVLTEPGHENQGYEITGDAAYSLHELAEMLSAEKGLPMRYVNCADTRLHADLLQAGLTSQVADSLVNMAQAIKAGEFSYVDAALERLLRRPRRALSAFLKTL